MGRKMAMFERMRDGREGFSNVRTAEAEMATRTAWMKSETDNKRERKFGGSNEEYVREGLLVHREGKEDVHLEGYVCSEVWVGEELGAVDEAFGVKKARKSGKKSPRKRTREVQERKKGEGCQ